MCNVQLLMRIERRDNAMNAARAARAAARIVRPVRAAAGKDGLADQLCNALRILVGRRNGERAAGMKVFLDINQQQCCCCCCCCCCGSSSVVTTHGKERFAETWAHKDKRNKLRDVDFTTRSKK